MVLATGDPRLVARLGQLAREAALTVVGQDDVPQQPVVAIVDLDRGDGLDTVRGWRDRWPETLLVGHLGVPDRDRWVAAQRAGCDLVANRGALVPRLRERLDKLSESRPRRYPLFEAADAAGRLGVVFRTDDTPVGPVAVYRAAGRLCAVSDRCPHAGQALSVGSVDGIVVTCPGHGSQFDVRTGERLRGPADDDIATFQLVEEGGQVFLLFRAQR